MDSNNMYQNQPAGGTEPNQQSAYNYNAEPNQQSVYNTGSNGSYSSSDYSNNGYNDNGYNNDYNGAYHYGGGFNNGGGYAPPVYQPDMEEPVGIGEWIITMLIMMVPCVNIVMLFVWAFGSSAKKSKSNYCKAGLIMAGIIFALYLLIVIFAVVAGASLFRY